MIAIDNKEDEIIKAVKAEQKLLIEGVNIAEMKRNRSRVSEICNLILFQQQELDESLDAWIAAFRTII